MDALRIRLRWGPLRQQNMANGDVKGITILYAIDLQTDGGTWTEVLNTRISDKTSANYERSHRIDLPKADFGWQVRVRRITPNAIRKQSRQDVCAGNYGSDMPNYAIPIQPCLACNMMQKLSRTWLKWLLM